MEASRGSRRSFLKAAAGAAGAAVLTESRPQAQAAEAADGTLMAYVGTFSSPLRDTLPTQVDLPPGNGRGIHMFTVDRATGELRAAGVHEM
ncbi:MAG TPA: twin-arginine translocation signal domain-containing protein, partial [Armatimonadota bacterium]|nr:twin-arginine translocation signal domain-containing protein [Armatimonadota bacterium]